MKIISAIKDSEKLYLFFLIGIFLTISNQLRFFNLPIGVGELIILISTLLFFTYNIKTFSVNYIKHNLLLFFWIIYFILLLFGYSISQYFGLESNLDYILHDIFAYIFIFMIVLLFFHFLKILGREKILYYFEVIIYFSVLFYLFIFLFALLFPEFELNFRYPLLVRSIGLSNNPNQPALYFSVIPFLWIYFVLKYKYYDIKFNILFFLLILLITYSFKSDSNFLGYVGSICICLILYFFEKAKIYIKLFLIILILIILIICIINFNEIAYKLDGESYHGRLELILNAFYHFDKIVYFGFGPGPHSFQSYDNNLWEVHNNFIDVFTQVGILGVILFLYINFYIAKGLFKNKEYILFMGFISLVIFTNFHFTFRQPIFWFFMCFFYIMSQGDKKCVE